MPNGHTGGVHFSKGYAGRDLLTKRKYGVGSLVDIDYGQAGVAVQDRTGQREIKVGFGQRRKASQ